MRPLYLSPVLQERRAFAFRHYKGSARYEEGLCPKVESLHFRELLVLAVVRPPAQTKDMDDILRAIRKVLESKEELLANEKEARAAR